MKVNILDYEKAFLKRTGFDVLTKDEPKDFGKLVNYHFDNQDMYNAIQDAFKGSEEYHQYLTKVEEEEYKEEEALLTEKGCVEAETWITYRYGSTGSQADYHDTKTIVTAKWWGTGISFTPYGDEYVEIRANGNGELRCLAKMFKEIGEYLEKKI